MIAVCAPVLIASAQEPAAADGQDIMFGVKLPEKTTLSQASSDLLRSKVEQILGRCNAGAAGDRDVFVVEPTVNVGDENRTEGLVQNVASLSGELVLAAKNRYDGSVYYTTTVPLKVAAKGTSAEMETALVRSIKPSDAVYVRFVRNARRNIAQYIALHPEVLIIPDAPEPPVIVVVMPGESPAPDAAPAAAEPASQEPVAESPASPAAPAPEIYCSEHGWNVTLKSCVYDATTRSILFTLVIKNMAPQADRRNLYTCVRSAIAADGTNYHDFLIDEFYHDYPYDIPVTVTFGIKNVYSNPGKVPFVETSVGNCKIEIRNLSVQ